MELVLKEPQVYDYPEHLDEFRNLKKFIIDESAKERVFTEDLDMVAGNLNKVIEVMKKL